MQASLCSGRSRRPDSDCAQFFAAVAVILLIALPAMAASNVSMHTSAAFDGHAHWYGGQFHGRRTASGAVFDKRKLTAAHPSLPFGTRVKVHSKYSGRDVVVTITDRCPALKQRCIDLSEGAARKLGIYPYAPCAVHCVVLK